MRTREQRDADFAHLRTIAGGDDFFMRGHRIKKIRTALPRSIPAWTQDDESVRQFLLEKFPVLILGARRDWPTMMLRIALLPQRQRIRAQRQVERAVYVYAIIRMVYRMRQTERQTAYDLLRIFPGRKRTLGEETQAVKDVLKVVREHAA